jgi:pyrimidine-nucleoside phosphorylase
VKCGNGAFFTEQADAEAFADLAVRIGREFDRSTGYVISSMDQPLGYAVGNALEVDEVLTVAEGRLPTHPVVDNCLALGSLLLVSAGIGRNEQQARHKLLELLENGMVTKRLHLWIAAQGGRLDEFRKLMGQERQDRFRPVRAVSPGVVAAVDALAIGRLANRLGAGRSRKDDAVDPFAGLELFCRPGSRIEQGVEIAWLYPGRSCKLSEDEMDDALRSAVRMEP